MFTVSQLDIWRGFFTKSICGHTVITSSLCGIKATFMSPSWLSLNQVKLLTGGWALLEQLSFTQLHADTKPEGRLMEVP
ncbi:hypothetical protein F7725_028633 [Dissostichus mawsoni]|uniref:Uncharacterized protein n=1 Tax=Dissostichus mawsoni TaxID=36200 RepID=A0A7J5XG78_DISMA|nr:hypothetical protein F7725_028633 [Dissostichus mawsoni]